MPNTCVVTGCKSNYRSAIRREGGTRVFSFPKEANRRAAWVRAVSRGLWEPTPTSVVCIKHFRPEDVSLFEEYVDSDGHMHSRPREKPLLCKTAVPKLFPYLPRYSGEIIPKKRLPKQECGVKRKNEKEKVGEGKRKSEGKYKVSS